ncbi:MAG: winged helix-turn-helix domain-containing protein, partial [Halanaeroarchaeum sp.]
TRIDPDDLTEVQLETLASIYEDPEATQAALADRLGVADATINQRLSTIDGFEWERRETLVSNLFEGSDLELDAGTGRDQEPVTGGPVDVEEVESRLADLVDERTAEFSTRLRDVERSIDERLDGGDGRDADRLDDALLTKVVRACVTDDSITEEEERRIIEYLR